MAIELISKIKPKNNGSFPLVDASDVLVSTDENGNEKRLDEALEEAKAPETIEASTVKFNNGDTLPEAMSKLTLGGVQVDNDSIVMDESGVISAKNSVKRVYSELLLGSYTVELSKESTQLGENDYEYSVDILISKSKKLIELSNIQVKMVSCDGQYLETCEIIDYDISINEENGHIVGHIWNTAPTVIHSVSFTYIFQQTESVKELNLRTYMHLSINYTDANGYGNSIFFNYVSKLTWTLKPLFSELVNDIAESGNHILTGTYLATDATGIKYKPVSIIVSKTLNKIFVYGQDGEQLDEFVDGGCSVNGEFLGLIDDRYLSF